MTGQDETDLRVTCTETGAGWSCDVTVSDARSTSEHVVTISRAEIERYGDGSDDAEAVVSAAFRFLLDREPKESILGRFALSDIERYFPEFGRS